MKLYLFAGINIWEDNEAETGRAKDKRIIIKKRWMERAFKIMRELNQMVEESKRNR